MELHRPQARPEFYLVVTHLGVLAPSCRWHRRIATPRLQARGDCVANSARLRLVQFTKPLRSARCGISCCAWVLAAQHHQHMQTQTWLVLLVLLHLLDSTKASSAEAPKSNQQRVRDYLSAYNQREVDTLWQMVSDDIRWLSVAGQQDYFRNAGQAPTVRKFDGLLQVRAERQVAVGVGAGDDSPRGGTGVSHLAGQVGPEVSNKSVRL
jgi:hypothetical protein